MKTILIIDDDESCRETTATLLRAHDWNVSEAADGEEGLTKALEERPDLILCDLLMPRTNGFRLCRSVREHPDLKHTPLIVMSGRDYPSDRQSAAEAGASEYLVKPVREAELTAALERQLPLVRPSAAKLDGAAPAAKPAGFHPPQQGTLVRFWGVRGSIPTPGPTTLHYGGNTSCVEVRADGELIVLDAGTGIRMLGLALVEEFAEQPLAITLLVSHTHWDHIQGFPFFNPAYQPKNRLRILGYEGASASLAATLAGQMESPYFPIPLDQMPGNLVIEELRDMEFEIGRVKVETCFSRHPGVCVGYRLNTEAGSVVYVPDNEWSGEQAEALDGQTPCTPESSLLKFVTGADVLIIDAQYDREEYDSHVGWGHGCVDDVVRLAVTAKVKQLFLFHHDPGHDDAFVTAMLERARGLAKQSGSDLIVEAAREGQSVVLKRV